MESHIGSAISSLKAKINAAYVGKWVFIGSLIGIIAGIGAIILYTLINVFNNLILVEITGFSVPRTYGGTTYILSLSLMQRLLIPVSTVLGGLLAGFIVYRFAPEAEGHGTDAAIDAFHNKEGRIRRRIPVVKTVASAITIGSGGSAGREGPTAQIAAGFGSFIADAFGMDDHDRRIAMAAGIGAGIGSIFLAPLGGAILSTEILYRKDFEVEALIPSIIASFVGYLIFGATLGYRNSLFLIPTGGITGFRSPESLLLYLILGIVAGLVGKFYVVFFYGIQRLFSKMKRISRYFRPAIGGLVVGIIAIFIPEVLGLGYGWIQLIFYGNLAFPFWMLLIIVLAKIVATSFTIGSGGSGGVFAPGMVIGGFLGASIYGVFSPFFPTVNVIDLTVVGMISFFGGVSKAPVSIIIMGTEMTGGYSLFFPLMLTTLVAYFVCGDKYSIYSKQVDNRAASPAHAMEYEKPVLDEVSVLSAVNTNYPYVSPETNLLEAVSKIRETKTKSVVVQKDGKLIGLLSIEDIDMNKDLSKVKAWEVLNPNPPKVNTSANAHQVFDLLSRSPLGKVVVTDDKGKVVGTCGLYEIADAYNREIRKIKHEKTDIK
ncbi:MAG: chloride channel protein [Thermoplasmata archaeon]